MLIAEQCFLDCINAPVRSVKARVELYNGSTLLNTFKYNDRLISFTIERVGESSKFFGYGICQRLNVHIIDKDRELDITTANTLEVAFGTGCNYVYNTPLFHVSEVHRDEITNELSVTAYDAIYPATAHTFSELVLPESYSIRDVAFAVANILNLPIASLPDGFDTVYPDGANYDGTEHLRDVLDDIAEATQTIYYIDSAWNLTFKRLDKDGAQVLDITKNNYFTLNSSSNRRLAKIVHATELGDDVYAALEVTGTTQQIRDNPLWDMREDVADLVDAALERIGGIAINQFECSWRGNYLLEIGDKIALTTKDDDVVYSYVLDDTWSYDGTFSERTQWNYEETASEESGNATSLGEVIKQTYARVNKQDKEITLLASEIGANKESISSLYVNTESIVASVRKIEDETINALGAVNEDISKLTSQVEAAVTASDVQIAIKSELNNGVNKVVTETGYKLDSEGLTISKGGSEMSTQITEDGMTVFRDDTAMLVANNEGVNAANLHATTYLIIGKNSRLEDYGERTGCFWIGGVD